MFNLPNPGSNPANPFYHRTREEQRRALEEAVTVELDFKSDAEGKKAGGKMVRKGVYKMTFKNNAEMNKFMDTHSDKLNESTAEYRAMMKKYKGSDAEKVFKMLRDEGFKVGEQDDTLVRNLLKRHRGNVKKVVDQIVKDYPGKFDVNRMMMDHVEIDEATVDTSHYRSDHGKRPNPNETGGWSFSDKKFGKEFYMSPNKMPYKDAKVEAQKIAKKKGFSKIYLAASYHPEFADDNVQLDEASVYKRPVKISALGGQKNYTVVDRKGNILRAGKSEKEAKSLRQFGQKVMHLPGAKVGQIVESRDDFDDFDVKAAQDDRMFTAKKFIDALKKAGIKHEYVRYSGTMRVAKKDLGKAQGIGKRLKSDKVGIRMDVLKEDVQLDEAYEVTFQFKGSKTKFMSRVKEFQNSGAMTGFSELDKRIEGRPNMVKMTFKSKSDFNKFFSQGVSGGVVKVQENVELDEMSARQHYNKMVAQGKVGRGGRVVTPIDRDRFPNREKEGLEGPFRSRKSGQVYYYDKKAGKYYDPLSDMYLQVKDVMENRVINNLNDYLAEGTD